MKWLIVLLLAGCSVPEVKTHPTCLNVQEGERHVEFDGRFLRLAEEGSPRSIPLASGDEVRCERLEILRNARHAAVLIEYSTKADRKLAIATIKDAKWILEPVVLTTKTEEKRRYSQSTSPDGKALITLKDSQTGESKTIAP